LLAALVVFDVCASANGTDKALRVKSKINIFSLVGIAF
jgi:hypothetical protein